MANEVEDKLTGELTAPAPAPIVKKYVVAIDKPKDDQLNRSALAHDALNWRGNKGDVLPDELVAALTAQKAYVGDMFASNPVTTLQQWLNIGWIKEA